MPSAPFTCSLGTDLKSVPKVSGKRGLGRRGAGVPHFILDLNDRIIRGGKECNVTVGINWYLRPQVRLMVNCILVRVKDRSVPKIDYGRADIVTTRFQVGF